MKIYGAIIASLTIPTLASADSAAIIGLGFAIPADVAVRVSNELIANCKASDAYLGIKLAADDSATETTSEGVALAATLIGTPVLGLSTLLVSKLLRNPLGKVVAYEYQVTGSWDNPQVTRISAPAPQAAAAKP